MTAQVENTPTANSGLQSQFIIALEAIIKCQSKSEIMIELEDLGQCSMLEGLNFGSGSDHIWVSERNSGKRLIFVDCSEIDTMKAISPRQVIELLRKKVYYLKRIANIVNNAETPEDIAIEVSALVCSDDFETSIEKVILEKFD